MVYVWFDALLVYLSDIGYPWNAGTGTSMNRSDGVANAWPGDLQIIERHNLVGDPPPPVLNTPLIPVDT